jgi:hypothetical protein
MGYLYDISCIDRKGEEIDREEIRYAYSGSFPGNTLTEKHDIFVNMVDRVRVIADFAIKIGGKVRVTFCF